MHLCCLGSLEVAHFAGSGDMYPALGGLAVVTVLAVLSGGSELCLDFVFWRVTSHGK